MPPYAGLTGRRHYGTTRASGRRRSTTRAVLEHEIERRQHDKGEQGGREQSSNHHHRQRLLGLRADVMRQRHRHETHHGEEAGHENGSQPHQRAFQYGFLRRQAAVPQLVEVGDHYHAVQHRLAEQRDEADRRRYRERYAGDEEREDAADQGERYVEDDEGRALQRLERVEQQDEDEQDGYWNDDRQALHGPFLVLEFAGPAHHVTRRQLHLLGDSFL